MNIARWADHSPDIWRQHFDQQLVDPIEFPAVEPDQIRLRTPPRAETTKPAAPKHAPRPVSTADAPKTTEPGPKPDALSQLGDEPPPLTRAGRQALVNRLVLEEGFRTARALAARLNDLGVKTHHGGTWGVPTTALYLADCRRRFPDKIPPAPRNRAAKSNGGVGAAVHADPEPYYAYRSEGQHALALDRDADIPAALTEAEAIEWAKAQDYAALAHGPKIIWTANKEGGQ